ncbi:MAG: glycosyltransferase family 4 protein [Euryarchaeota archaeon]|nr:glycosyltransferase family 4 protein [Euryarchaeota archaeon]
MEKYRIAMVSDWYYPKVGGIEYAMHALAVALSRRGHEVSIITRRYPQACRESEGVEVIRVGRAREGRLLEPGAYVELWREIGRGGYEVVHAHGLDSPLSLGALAACRRLSLPVVVTNHSLIGSTPLKPLLLLGGRLVLRLADAVIAVSTAVAEECRRMGARRVYVVPNGIDSAPPAEAELPFSTDGKVVIATVARMTKKKGVEDVVKIAEVLLKRHRNLMFLMVGDGPLRKRVESRVRRLGLHQHFHFTGRVPREQVLSLLEHAHIFLLPSRDEAFGVAVLEALSKGAAVVAKNHSGVSDIITHGRTGILADTLEEMAEWVDVLVENPELRRRLCTGGLQELRRYEWSSIARRVEGIYSEVLHAKAGTDG